MTTEQLETELIGSNLTLANWSSEKVDEIYSRLEVPNWAPWLAAGKESLAGRVRVFPDGQLLILSNDVPVASLSMNRINWDGDPSSLPCWDDVAGDPTTYENTYDPSGNTLVMMSMNVDPLNQGKGLARKLIEHARLLAVVLDTDYLIGSFRPNEFGKYKSIEGNELTRFSDYIEMRRPDGLPLDSWLRNLARNGMNPLQIDNKAMTVGVPMEELDFYKKNYNLAMWKEVLPGVWECGEVGAWNINSADGTATYKESNLWGVIWQKPGLR